MRSLHVIKTELREVKESYRENVTLLEREIKEFQEKCPHPEWFLTTKSIDFEDDGPGVPRYAYTENSVTCNMCEKTRNSEGYNKKICAEPVPRDIIDQ